MDGFNMNKLKEEEMEDRKKTGEKISVKYEDDYGNNIFDNDKELEQAINENRIDFVGTNYKPRVSALDDSVSQITKQLMDWIGKKVDEAGGVIRLDRTFVNENLLKKIDPMWAIPKGYVAKRDKYRRILYSDKEKERPNAEAMKELRATIKMFDENLTAGSNTKRDYIRFSRIKREFYE